MRRPADQAKLLFLYLLRSSAALATESKLGATSASSAASAEASALAAAAVSRGGMTAAAGAGAAAAHPPTAPLAGHIALRVARRSDVPHIQRCNLATLPENYSANFYAQHMRQWPELALVAEHVPPGGKVGGGGQDAAAPPPLKMELSGSGGFSRANQVRPFGNAGYYGEDEYGEECPPRIVGYVLGKVDRGVMVRDYPSDPFATDPSSDAYSDAGSARNRVVPRSVIGDDDGESSSFLWDTLRPNRNQPRVRRENLGHVTSLAVLPDFRRRGLAAELMDALHLHMCAPPYRADAVGLHVRVSNRAATRLYGGGDGRAGMGYKVVDVIRGYYQDGEDAYFMRKEFAQDYAGDAWQSGATNGSNGGGGRVRRALDKLRIASGGGGAGRSALRMMSPWEGGDERSGARGRQQQGLLKCIPLARDAEVVSKTLGTNDRRGMDAGAEEGEEQQVMSGAA